MTDDVEIEALRAEVRRLRAAVHHLEEEKRDLEQRLAFLAQELAYTQAMQSIHELRQEMGRLLEETVVLVGSLPEGDMPRGTWEHPSLGPLNLKELIALHRLHVMDHVQQIEKIKTDPGYPRRR